MGEVVIVFVHVGGRLVSKSPGLLPDVFTEEEMGSSRAIERAWIHGCTSAVTGLRGLAFGVRQNPRGLSRSSDVLLTCLWRVSEAQGPSRTLLPLPDSKTCSQDRGCVFTDSSQGGIHDRRDGHRILQTLYSSHLLPQASIHDHRDGDGDRLRDFTSPQQTPYSSQTIRGLRSTQTPKSRSTFPPSPVPPITNRA